MQQRHDRMHYGSTDRHASMSTTYHDATLISSLACSSSIMCEGVDEFSEVRNTFPRSVISIMASAERRHYRMHHRAR